LNPENHDQVIFFQVLMMSRVSKGHRLVPGRIFFLQHGSAVFAAVLLSLFSMETPAQDENETCPCFSYGEVEAIFLRGQQLTAEEGMSACQTADYSVECNAEVVIWDQDFTLIAQARVDWFDFDPSRCEYIDTTGNPGVERSVSWPHPAPEAVARACFNIISSVISKADTTGKCDIYP
jgi:hypothetical protein